ncbi:MAG: Fic/DOC family N-terminal domain-containing protein [Tissierellia bacterium]|nr:Fic/DOC family N-terminal domain-containing protein [Tissierellia bacterium]
MKESRAGYYHRNLEGDLAYLSFCPAKLPLHPGISLDYEWTNLLIEAHKVLSVLDEKSKNIPSMDMFISMYVQKEALLSSQMEGTQATLEDIFDPNRDVNMHGDVKDVVNYTKAIQYAIQRLKDLPLCNRLLMETHKILLSDGRGKEKNPGEFRNSQNWIDGTATVVCVAGKGVKKVEDWIV